MIIQLGDNYRLHGREIVIVGAYCNSQHLEYFWAKYADNLGTLENPTEPFKVYENELYGLREND